MRKLTNFIDGFSRYMANKGSPAIYTRWAGIFTVSAVAERKIWLRTTKGILYPNQYIILVGPAGIGKSVCTNVAYDLLSEIRSPENELHIAPTSVTKASLIDALEAADRRIIRPMQNPPVDSFNALSIIPNELGVFLPSWEGDFMNTMTDLWDCKRYSETRRTRNLAINVPNPQLNMLSATTPSYLNTLLPEGAWETGFMSRTLLAYSSEIIFTDLFIDAPHDEALWADLTHDLRCIYKLYGELNVIDETREMINAWAKSGGRPAPDHPKLMSYNTRRVAHLLKLCMVAAVANDSDLIVSPDHFVEALDWLTELETFIPDIFKSMRTGGDAVAIEECYHFVYHEFMRKQKKPVPEHLVYAFLQERVPVHNVERIIDVMTRAKLLDKAFTDAGTMGFIPVAKAA